MSSERVRAREAITPCIGFIAPPPGTPRRQRVGIVFGATSHISESTAARFPVTFPSVVSTCNRLTSFPSGSLRSNQEITPVHGPGQVNLVAAIHNVTRLLQT